MSSGLNLKQGDANIGDLSNVVASASFTVGAENTGAGTINVAVQLKDWKGADLTYPAAMLWYLASDSAGLNFAAATSGGIAIGTDGSLAEWTTNVSGMVVSEADGDIDVTLTEASTGTWYLVLVLHGGKLAVSGAITFV